MAQTHDTREHAAIDDVEHGFPLEESIDRRTGKIEKIVTIGKVGCRQP